jgi:signal transduction histidine kinase
MTPVLSDVVLILDDVLKEMEVAFANKKIKITSKVKGKIPKVSIDQKLVRVVFQNYLSNAVKYSPNGAKISSELSVVKIDKDKFLQLKVSDNGYGIPKSQADKIFSKLFRADNVRSMEVEGTGLGLYIVKSIIEESGGKVWFNSAGINKGSTFYVAIPLSGMKQKSGTRELTLS